MTATWRSAVRTDRGALQAFTCVSSDAPWEREVQGYIRDLRVPLGGRRIAILGMVGSDIAGVAVVLDERSHARFFHIQLLAVSVDQRGRGVADGAVGAALAWCARQALDAETGGSILVSANVHQSNAHAQTCFARNAFTRSPSGDRSSYQEWLLRVIL